MSRGIEVRGSFRTQGVPRALGWAAGKFQFREGLPGADIKNTGDQACLDVNVSARVLPISAHPRGGGGPAQSFQTERIQFCNSALGPRLRGDERRRVVGWVSAK